MGRFCGELGLNHEVAEICNKTTNTKWEKYYEPADILDIKWYNLNVWTDS